MKKNTTKEILGSAIPIIIAIVLFVLDKYFPEIKFPDWFVYHLIFYATFAIALWLLILEKRENKSLVAQNQKLGIIDKVELENRIIELEKKNKKPDYESIKYRRFEQIKNKKEIVFGHIDYLPFFKMNQCSGSTICSPSGIGYAILEEIFKGINVKIKEHEESSSWKNIFDRLHKGDYDIIGTPLYETRTRIYEFNLTYCIPLFYSEVGLFIHEDDFSNELTLKQIKEIIKSDSTKWKSPFIEGEISDIIATKANIKNIKGNVHDDSNGFLNLLKKVNKRTEPDFNIVAMEVFKAKSLIRDYNKDKPDKEKLKLVNVLAAKQLLYPVSFAVKKEDTVMRNFINLRIAEIRDRKACSRDAQGKITDVSCSRNLIDIVKDEAYKSGIPYNEVDEQFIQYYDFSQLESYQEY